MVNIYFQTCRLWVLAGRTLVILFTGNSILDLRREVNPSTIQMSEEISKVVRDGLQDIW